MEFSLEWAAANKAEAAWYIYGVLVAISLGYRGTEAKLKAWAGRSESKTDDKLVAGVSHIFALFTLILDGIAHAAPAFVQKGRKHETGAFAIPSIPPPAPTPEPPPLPPAAEASTEPLSDETTKT